MSDKQTKFEKDLEAFFPDIYKIHERGKWDQYIWEVFEAMMEMIDCSSYGEIKVIYQAGRINKVIQSKSRINDTGHSPKLTHPGKI